MNDSYDCITFFNTKLELLRQTEANRVVIDKAVHETFSHLMNSKLPKENKLFFAISLTRIVWATRISPENCLDVIASDIETIFKLPMPNRYYAFKDLNLLFMDLHGDIAESHHKIREAANSYMSNQAESDLESYRKELPKDAIFEKGFCYRESAGLQKKSLDHYDLKKILSYIKSASALYHENSLLIEENICRLDIMDELCDAKNLNENHKIIYRDEMLSQLVEIETYLSTLAEQTNLAEFYLRLCFYCMHLDDYEKCIIYYKKFVMSSVSLEHFAPWLHRYHMYNSFVVRTFYFLKAIQTIKGSKGIIQYPSMVQQWFESFPSHDGFVDSILLGKFMGFSSIIPLKQKTWIDPLFKDGSTPRIHTWFWMVPLELNLDITYSQFEDDNYSNCILFDNDRHPLESNTSNKICADMNNTGLNFIGAKQTNLLKDGLPPEQIIFIDNLYSIIIAHVNPECPTIEKIKALFKDTSFPVEV
jgi:hypothetical protein